MPKYYSTPFDPADIPQIERVDYHGYKFNEVIDSHKQKTFRDAKRAHKNNLKEMIRLCEIELKKLNKLKIEDLQETSIF